MMIRLFIEQKQIGSFWSLLCGSLRWMEESEIVGSSVTRVSVYMRHPNTSVFNLVAVLNDPYSICIVMDLIFSSKH